MQARIKVITDGKGLYPILSSPITELIKNNKVKTGIIHLFAQHTSCSLVIQENADPTARQDLEAFINRLIPDDQSWHRHTLEGPDDSSAHMKSSITNSSLSIPIIDGEIGLGVWQGLYLWEHRDLPQTRNLVVTIVGSI